ncbi:MAG: AI-2E family transporter [Planctomycetaceae bacterium]|nr:AI-2E family transporter [Planctomycetaceae bacterium]
MQKPSGIGTKFLLASAAIIVILAGLKAAQDLIAPLFLAVFFALILTPPLRWLKKKGLSEFIAIITLSTFVFMLGLGIVLLFSNSLTHFTKKLPVYTEKVSTAYTTIDTWINDAADRFQNIGESIYQFNPIEQNRDEAVDEEEYVEEYIEADMVPDILPTSRERLSLSNVIPVNDLISLVQFGINRLLNIATVSTLVIIMLVFMLVEAARIPDKVKEAFEGRDLSNEYLQKIADDTWNYMKIKTIICFLTGLSTAIVLWILGVEYAALWGMLMFFLNYIPNIGQIIASIPPILLALIDGGLSLGIWVTLWLIIINSFWGLCVEPRYMGQGLGISSLVVLLSLIFWGWLLGPVGMFLSAPLTMVVKIVLQNDAKTKWIAVLLSNR